MDRRRIVTGNWKMNKTPKEAVELVSQLKDGINTDALDVVLCVPYVALADVGRCIEGTSIKLGAQNMHFETSGAYTGEVSGLMLKELGVEYVIIGHSERRQYFNETDQTVNKKIHKALEYGINPIMCCGETLVQREAGVTMEKIRMQVKRGLQGLTPRQAAKIVIAYEPIWAIGTGKHASNNQAERVCAGIRCVLSEIFDEPTAAKMRIVYGGSVTGNNAKNLFDMENIDGALVGGASLKLDFENIVKA
ncbi:MAG TPA: triose-phosphate isomerase [Lachnospiraceae bacterium]|nr:triose-phosphate isomerase [Lachnospiraceae bacterium]